MGKFKECNGEVFVAKLINANRYAKGQWLETGFYYVAPSKEKMALKEMYKSEGTDLYKIYSDTKMKDSQFIDKIRDNMIRSGFAVNSSPINDQSASFKLHCSLNNLPNLDETKFLSIIQSLLNEKNPNLNFDLKFIPPELLGDRFKNNDQITIYFDNYSSVGEILLFAKKINALMSSQNIKKNEFPMGPKDIISFNSFVSARFDTNKLLGQYDVFRFFDLELNKFFKRYESKTEDIAALPVCVFEIIFNEIIGEINIPHKESQEGLSTTDSNKVQDLFDKIIKNPWQYMEKSIEEKKLIAIQEDIIKHHKLFILDKGDLKERFFYRLDMAKSNSHRINKLLGTLADFCFTDNFGITDPSGLRSFLKRNNIYGEQVHQMLLKSEYAASFEEKIKEEEEYFVSPILKMIPEKNAEAFIRILAEFCNNPAYIDTVMDNEDLGINNFKKLLQERKPEEGLLPTHFKNKIIQGLDGKNKLIFEQYFNKKMDSNDKEMTQNVVINENKAGFFSNTQSTKVDNQNMEQNKTSPSNS